MNRREMLKGTVEGLMLAAAGNTVFASENANQNAVISDSKNIAITHSNTGAVHGTFPPKLEHYVNVLDFMTEAQVTDVQANTASLDVTNAIQAAHDALTSTGGTLYFPNGSYLLAVSGRYVNISKSNINIAGAAGALVVNPASSDAEVTTGTRYLNGFAVTGNNCVISLNMRGCVNIWTASAATDRFTMRDMKMTNLYNSGISINNNPFDTLDVINVEFNTSRALASDPGNYQAISRGCNGNTANYGKLVRVSGCLFRGVSGGIDVHNVKDVVVTGGTRFEGCDVLCIKLATLDNVFVKQNLTVDSTVTFEGTALKTGSANRHLACTFAAGYTGYLGFIQVFDKIDFSGKAYNFGSIGMRFLDGSFIDSVLNFNGAEFENCPNAIADYQGMFNVTGCRFKTSNITGSAFTQSRTINISKSKFINSVINISKKCADIFDKCHIVDNDIAYSLDNLAPIRFTNYAIDTGLIVIVDRNNIRITGKGNILAIDGSTSGTQMFLGSNNNVTATAGTPVYNGISLVNFQPTTTSGYSGGLYVPLRNGEMTIVNTDALGSIVYIISDEQSPTLQTGTIFNVCKTNNANGLTFYNSSANSINGAYTTAKAISSFASATFKKIAPNKWALVNQSGTWSMS